MSNPATWLQRLLPARSREKLRDRFHRVQAFFLPEPYRTVLPYTMVGLKRLQTLDRLARQVDELGIHGDIVECGTCNGGSAAILARVACRSPLGRHTWLLDSFAGLPPAGDRDGALARDYTGLCHGHPDRVREVLRRVGVPEQAVTLVGGWFQDTLPTLGAERIALLHIDADWYDSVLVCLNHLYDRVQPGGFVVLDDFGYWEGCRRAWHDFQAARGLRVTLTAVDGTGVYFQKP